MTTLLLRVSADDFTSRARENEISELANEEIIAAKSGDPTVFRRLVAFYAPRVHRFLWRMCEYKVGRAGIEDLHQETFLRVYRALPHYEIGGPAKMSSWIFTIASRLALTEISRHDRRLSRAVDSHPESLHAASTSNDVILRNAVVQAFSRLSGEQRALVILREYEGKSYDEIAAILKFDGATVKSRLHRAREILRAALKEFVS